MLTGSPKNELFGRNASQSAHGCQGKESVHILYRVLEAFSQQTVKARLGYQPLTRESEPAPLPEINWGRTKAGPDIAAEIEPT